MISGIVSTGTIPLPGVALTASSADRVLAATSSAVDGAYVLRFTGEGTLVLRARLAAFAPLMRTITIDQTTCQSRVDLTMTLASRTANGGAQRTLAASRGRGALAQAPRVAGIGGRGTPNTAQIFQSLDLVADQAGLTRQAEAGDTPVADQTAQLLLPPGFSTDLPTESVTSFGNAGQFNEGLLFGPGRGEFGEGFGEGRGGFGEPGQEGRGRGEFAGGRGDFGRGGLGGGPGGRGGPGGGAFAGPGGRGAPGIGGRLANERIRAQAFDTIAASAFDARPYSLNGQPTPKSAYFQQRLGGSVGGPLKPGGGSRTSFFVNYSGNHLRSPYDSYATVPTLEMRRGDFSSRVSPLLDPSTGQPFANNQIPDSRLNPVAKMLLPLFPEPNQLGDRQNFHYVTTTSTNNDDVNVRIVRNFGERRGRGGGRARGGGRGGGVNNLNFGVHYRHGTSVQNTAFPDIKGKTSTAAWDVPVNYSFALGGVMNMLRVQFNRNKSQTTNAFAFERNVAGEAGVAGVSQDPFDWGAPNLSFSSINSVRDVNPAMRVDRTISIGETMLKIRGRHALRWGGDFRDQRFDSRTDPNARGTFVFTGLFTGGATSGLDFADFLLGLPQQATVQYGPGVERFRGRAWNLFLQDDWRARGNFTLNAGVRYEYVSPFAEADNRLVNLDAPPDFTAAVPVVAGGEGPFSGSLPITLVRPDRNNIAPRIGLAWRADRRTVVRGGYGINYNAGGYAGIAQQLAVQPPFATTDTKLATFASPITLADAFSIASPGTTTNTFGIDPDYRLGFVQIWNADVQRDLTRTIVMSGGYTGTKGGDLDLLRAPNRGPAGLRIQGVQPFIWESSGATSTMHSVTLRLRKRPTRGFSAGGQYTLSKSTDNASSIGGGGSTVAQNDQDLEAERGPSSFDQRHRLSADATWELPFGPRRRWFDTDSVWSHVLRGWMWNADVQLASGLPFTARVLGDVRDVSRGTNGTLRADYNGQPIAIDHPSVLQFFNTAAFSVPAAGTFGGAGRNSIRGPGQFNVNMGLTKNVTLKDARGLSIRIQATNVLNRPQFSAIDTVVNSPTFGRVISVRPMRSVQLVARVRF